MVRLARHGDEDQLIALSQRCYEAMDFDTWGYKFDYLAGKRNFGIGINNPNIVIVVSDDNGINGASVALITERSQYFDNHRTAQEIVFHADPSLTPRQQFAILKRLEEATTDELRARGVKSFYLGTDLRCPGVRSLLEKQGYKPMTVHLYKEIQK